MPFQHGLAISAYVVPMARQDGDKIPLLKNALHPCLELTCMRGHTNMSDYGSEQGAGLCTAGLRVCTSVLDHKPPVEGQVDAVHASLPQRCASWRITPWVIPAGAAPASCWACSHGAFCKQGLTQALDTHQKRSAVIRSRAGLKKKTTCGTPSGSCSCQVCKTPVVAGC